jgi:rhodanese-related sulfurtransferase/DNA-binding transcriptional ArsR family regulator
MGQGGSVKAQVFAELAAIGRAVGNPVRLELLDFLAQGECTVERLAEKCGQKIGNVSQHLRALARAGLVNTRRDGVFIYYSAHPASGALFDALGAAAAACSPVVQTALRTYYAAPEQSVRKSSRELVAEVQRRTVLLLDVRPAEEYSAGHIAHAINVPLADLKTHIKRLPKNVEIVAYCRGPFCVLSVEAVRALREAGFRASRLAEGYPQWKARRLPSEVGADGVLAP